VDIVGAGQARNPVPLPRTPWKGRVRNRIRRVERRWRRVFPSRLPSWSGPDGNTELAPPVARLVGDRLEISGDSIGQVRAELQPAALGIAVRAAVIEVARWRAPWPGWSGRLGALPGLVAHTVTLPAVAGGRATVEVEVSTPVAAYRLADAALAVLDPTLPLPATVSADVSVADGGRPPWLRSGVPAFGSGRVPRPRDRSGSPPVPAADLWLGGHPTSGSALTYSRYGAARAGEPERILVDTTTANPFGRGPGGHDLPGGELSITTNADGEVWWRVHTRGERATLVVAGRAGDPLDEPHRTALGRLGTLSHADSAAACADQPHASVLAQLAATGVVLHAPDLRPATEALLAHELSDIVGRPASMAADDPIEWELRSIAQRRAAMRAHGVDVALRGLDAGPAGPGLPTVSAVLVTRRPAYVARAIADLAAQTYPSLEIVLGLHGVDLAPEEQVRLGHCPVPVEVVSIPASARFGVALGIATGAARGSLIAKVDDDDRYGPEHIWDLVLARGYSRAAVVGKVAEFVHLAAYDATVRRRVDSELYTDVIAGGTMLLSRGDLDDVGGWRPLDRAVDRALLDRVLHAGGLIYRTHGFGYVYSRHGDGHTWNPGDRYFLLNPLRHWSGYPPLREFGTGGVD
jgi:hypothetical protein